MNQESAEEMSINFVRFFFKFKGDIENNIDMEMWQYYQGTDITIENK